MSFIRYAFVLLLWLVLVINVKSDTSIASSEEYDKERYVIEGKIYPLEQPFTQPSWQANTKIHVNGGEFLGFVREDGSFIIHNLLSGSYIVEALNSELTYESIRVEINSKGKYRARKVNHIQTSQVIQVPYPLRMKPLGRTKYFQVREQWRVTDVIFNPMVLMMLLPLALVMVLPKMMNDPETKKEMETLGNLTKIPDVSMSNFVNKLFSGNQPTPQQTNKKVTKAKKRQ